ncbi:GNAT family N-acetyltransferase [Nocardioides sp. C4-1]|uniref:GNAT family N-acetyltransferase n=1 Tax=Nocardioides sp. C4-1 TaxID=3151851 RepID=UPI003265B27A
MSTEPADLADLAGLTRRWAEGWAASRRMSVAERPDGVLIVDVGDDKRRAELLLVEPDDATLAAVGAEVVAAGDLWVSVMTAPDSEPVVPPGLVALAARDALMVRTPVHDGTAPDPCVRLVDDGDRLLATVAGEGDVRIAAQGQVGLVGTDVVFDRIGTDAAHRRRGLGTLVMTALAEHAARRGGVEGLLVATTDGQALYERLGWRSVGRFTTSAVRPSVSARTP